MGFRGGSSALQEAGTEPLKRLLPTIFRCTRVFSKQFQIIKKLNPIANKAGNMFFEIIFRTVDNGVYGILKRDKVTVIF